MWSNSFWESTRAISWNLHINRVLVYIQSNDSYISITSYYYEIYLVPHFAGVSTSSFEAHFIMIWCLSDVIPRVTSLFPLMQKEWCLKVKIFLQSYPVDMCCHSCQMSICKWAVMFGADCWKLIQGMKGIRYY